MQKDSLYEALCSQIDEEKYKTFVKKKGKPTDLSEEVFEVGFDNFVPFLNTECRRSGCLYDLGMIHEQYSESFDVTDAFKFNATFMCHICEKEIKYGDFFTSEKLAEDVELLFRNKLVQKF